MSDNIDNNTAMVDAHEVVDQRAEAMKLAAQMLSFAKSENRNQHIDLGHLLSSQWMQTHTEANMTSLRPLAPGILLHDVEITTPFPPEWLNDEAFNEAAGKFHTTVHPFLPGWLPSVLLSDDAVLNHDIDVPMKRLEGQNWVDIDADSTQFRFLRKSIDIAYSLIESKRGREVLQKLLKEIITQWDEEGEAHAFQRGRRNNRRFREASNTVDYFLNVLKIMPPMIKLEKMADQKGTCINGRMVTTEGRTEPVALDEFVPRDEFEIHVETNVSNNPIRLHASGTSD